MNRLLLQIAELNSWFKDESADDSTYIQTLNNVSLSIDHAKTVALVGESGSGKTVTALSILRLLEDVANIRRTGSILFEGNDLFSVAPEEMRKIRGNKISMIFQEPMTSLNPLYTVGNQLIEPLMLHRAMNKDEALAEALNLLSKTGIPSPEERLHVYPHQLSGGQRQRVMISMAIACRPKLLIADEPTTALDVTVQAQILNLLMDLQKEFDMAILLITHDLPMVKKIADYVHIMKNGTIVESGETERLFLSPEHPYTNKLLGSIPSSTAQKRTSSDLLISTQRLKCHFTLKGKWQGFFRRTNKTIKAVDDISISIAKGTTCGIVGESGSGKTTLGMAILRLIKSSSGDILFDGQQLNRLSSKEIRPLRKEMQIVFQDPFSSLSPRLTVEEIVAEGLKVHFPEINAEERHRMVIDALEEVGMESDMASRYPHEFSGGQRQRIAIARSIILRPKFLVLDEPTSALDMTIQAQIIELLLHLQKKYNLTYLFISHDLRVVRALADYIIIMQDGQIIESGAAEEIFTSPRQPYTRRLFEAALI